MPVRSTSTPRGDQQSPPGPPPARDEKGSEGGRQHIKKGKGQDEVELPDHVFAERILAGQCSGRNLEENENYDCPHHRHDSSLLQPVTKDITNRRAKSSTN